MRRQPSLYCHARRVLCCFHAFYHEARGVSVPCHELCSTETIKAIKVCHEEIWVNVCLEAKTRKEESRGPLWKITLSLRTCLVIYLHIDNKEWVIFLCSWAHKAVGNLSVCFDRPTHWWWWVMIRLSVHGVFKVLKQMGIKWSPVSSHQIHLRVESKRRWAFFF